MQKNKLDELCVFSIKSLFLILFFFTPFLFTPWNSELFEFNKMIFVYIMSTLIGALWLVRMLTQKQIIFKKTALDIPLIIFCFSITLSTVFSHDLYMSLFGYYSRFNQGLFSLFAYLILYFAFVSNIKNNYIRKLLFTILASSLIVAIYGIAQHFGFDFFRWVQDVKTRVFSSMGQPNWLGAYLDIMLMIAFGVYLSLFSSLNSEDNSLKLKVKNEKSQFKIKNNFSNGTTRLPARQVEQSNNTYLHQLKLYVLPITIIAILYTCLLFTRSRSAFAAFHACFFIFTLIYFKQFKKLLITTYLIFFILINAFNILPTPIEKINELTIPNLISKISTKTSSVTSQKKGASPSPFSSENGEGGTESFSIRKIVWKGAWNTFIHNPILGYGNETFALAYYKYKPVEQNLVSEWDFLYNKAHNEYLNYLATTGIIGFSTYILIIITFIIYYCRDKSRLVPTNAALFLAWLTILITNFVGFSVVIISVYFYLLPAIIIVLNQPSEQKSENSKDKLQQNKQSNNRTIEQSLMFLILLLATYYVIHTTVSWWFADTHFSKALSSENANSYQSAYEEYQKAVDLSNIHPNYHNEFALLLSEIPGSMADNASKDLIAKIADKAVAESNIATSISPDNPIFQNYRALIFHNLSTLNKNYSKKMIEAILKAKTLAPNDPKIAYYMGIYYLSIGEGKNALKSLQKAIELKPNYIEPSVNLAKLVFDAGDKKEATKILKNLLKYYPDNKNIKKLINEYRL